MLKVGLLRLLAPDEAPDPIDVSLSGARRVVHEADGVINLFEQLLGTRLCARFALDEGREQRYDGNDESCKAAFKAYAIRILARICFRIKSPCGGLCDVHSAYSPVEGQKAE